MPRRKAKLLFEENTRKVHPKVRMVTNGSASVNTVRAGTAGAVRVTDMLANQVPVDLPAMSKSALNEPRGRLRRKIAKQVEAAVFVRMNPTQGSTRKMPDDCGDKPARRGNLITAEVDLERLDQLAREPDVAISSSVSP